MRRIHARPDLPDAASARLAEKTAQILQGGDAKSIYSNSRSTEWFKPIVMVLAEMAGPGGNCMFCSHNESSNVEHYRPKARFPALAMVWENYLWVCNICNLAKSDRFPPDTEPGGRILNPVDDNPWDHLYINEQMMIAPRMDADSDAYDPRGLSTRDILQLNRDVLLRSRRDRFEDLCESVNICLSGHAAGTLSVENIHTKLERLRSHSFQPDVADYFLDGPGRTESPFRELFELLTD